MNVKLLCFGASRRAGSLNKQLASIAGNMAGTTAATVIHVDYSDFDAPVYDDGSYTFEAMPEGVRALIDLLNQVDGLVISSPEYNWSLPGSLKNLIDWVSCLTPCPLAGKTALLLSASPSIRGGTSGLLQLKLPLEALGVTVYPKMFPLSNANQLLDESGSIGDAAIADSLREVVEGYVRFAAALK